MNIPRAALLPLLLPCLLMSLSSTAAEVNAPASTPPFHPVYRIPLRVHLGGSGRPPAQWSAILAEINVIWLSQAGICYEIHTVDHDEPLESGLDLWFESTIPGWNGYFTDRHDMHVRDDPDLRPAPHPARSSAARTAAHELGHALNLRHRQDADDNLMRSKTYGWLLHPGEIAAARATAAHLALDDLSPVRCSLGTIHNRP